MKFASEEIRTMAVKAVLAKTATIEQMSQIIGYAVSTINNWIDIYQHEGRLCAKPNGHRLSCFSQDEREQLKALIAEHPDMTLEEIKSHFNKECTLSAIHRILVKLGLRFKKNLKGGRTESRRCERVS